MTILILIAAIFQANRTRTILLIETQLYRLTATLTEFLAPVGCCFKLLAVLKNTVGFKNEIPVLKQRASILNRLIFQSCSMLVFL